MQSILLQALGVILALTVTFFDIRGKVVARPLSMVYMITSLFVYYPAGLYSRCVFQCITFTLDTYGWYHWLYGGKNKTPLQVSKTAPGFIVALVVLGPLAAWGWGKLLAHYANTTLTYWDALNTIICIAAQWLLIRKKLETWLLWLLADALYTVVLYNKGLYLFSGLHICYIILTINGYIAWRQSYLQQPPVRISSEDEMT